MTRRLRAEALAARFLAADTPDILASSGMCARPDCPFCQPLPPERVLAASDAIVAFLDGFPVTPGHTLVVSRRHVASIFDLPEPDYRELWAQVAEVRKLALLWPCPRPPARAAAGPDPGQ